MGVVPNEEHCSNLTFVDEACVEGSVRTKASWWSSFSLGKKIPTPDVFSKPRFLASGVYNDSAAPYLAEYPLTVALLLQDPLWAAHLRGRSLLRATWVFRVTVAAPPQVGGWLRLAHEPRTALSTNTTAFRWSKSRICQLPGIDMDFNSSTTVELRIPHRIPEPYLSLTRQSSLINNGNFVLVPRLPLNVAGTNPFPRFSIWMWLEDVEIVGESTDPSLLTTIVPQSGDRRSNGEVKQDGPLSGFLGATARAVDWGSTLVPTLSSFASPLSWMLRAGAKVASAFGYSRPLDQHRMMSVRAKQWGHSHATGVEMGHNLATFHDTQVKVAPMCADDQDALSIPYLASQWFPMTEVSYTTSLAAQTPILTGSISPMAIARAPGKILGPAMWDFAQTEVTPGVKRSFVPSAACWLGSWFTYWSGTFKLKFLLSKTRFHGGRLLFAYDINPVNFTSSTTTITSSPNVFMPATIPNAHSTTKVIIDLAETNTFDIDIPFSYHGPLCPMSASIGSWALYVLDPLLAPEGVSTTVHIGVLGCMSQDTVFAVPRDSALYPDDQHGTHIVAQSGDRITTLANTVGEHVSSLKQLLLLPVACEAGNYFATTGTVRTSGTNLSEVPTYNSLLSHVRRFFSLERGAMVVTHVAQSGSEGSIMRITAQEPGIPRFPPLFCHVAPASELPRVIINRNAPLGATFNRCSPGLTLNPVGGSVTWVDPEVALLGGLTYAYASVSDDYSAHVWVGTKPMCVNTVAGY